MGKLKILSMTFILLVGCKPDYRSIFTVLNENEEAAPTRGVTDFESQWFQYPDSTCRNLNNLCVVKYYVNGDTVFTSEKYHFVSLGYSRDEDCTLAYQHIIFFDRSQKSNSDGWYMIRIDKSNIPREPNTHISSIALRAYYGDRYDNTEGRPHADAHLFNATKEVGAASDRNVLSPQLEKLYEFIK